MRPPKRRPVQSVVVRRSVLDAFQQLGGLENNSVVAKWVFEDPTDGFETVTAMERSEPKGQSMPSSGLENGVQGFGSWPPPDVFTSTGNNDASQASTPTSKFFKLTHSLRSVRSFSQTKRARKKTSDGTVGGYETDEGYASSSLRKRTRRRLWRSAKSAAASPVEQEDESSEPLPPVPPIPAVPSVSSAKPASFFKTISRKPRGATEQATHQPDEDIDEGWLEVTSIESTASPFVDVLEFATADVYGTIDTIDNTLGPRRGRRRRPTLFVPGTLFRPRLAKRKTVPVAAYTDTVTRKDISWPLNSRHDQHELWQPVPRPESPYVIYSTGNGLGPMFTPPSIVVPPEDDFPRRRRHFSETTASMASAVATVLSEAPLGSRLPVPMSQAQRRSVVIMDDGMTLYAESAYTIQRRSSAGSTWSLPQTVSVSSPGADIQRFPSIQRGRELPFPVLPLRPGSRTGAARDSYDVRMATLRRRYTGTVVDGQHQQGWGIPPVTCANCGEYVQVEDIEDHVCETLVARRKYF